jgi:hypothetical protein
MGIWLSLQDSVCIHVQPSVEFPFPLEGCAAASCFEGIVTHNIPAKYKNLLQIHHFLEKILIVFFRIVSGFQNFVTFYTFSFFRLMEEGGWWSFAILL